MAEFFVSGFNVHSGSPGELDCAHAFGGSSSLRIGPDGEPILVLDGDETLEFEAAVLDELRGYAADGRDELHIVAFFCAETKWDPDSIEVSGGDFLGCDVDCTYSVFVRGGKEHNVALDVSLLDVMGNGYDVVVDDSGLRTSQNR